MGFTARYFALTKAVSRLSEVNFSATPTVTGTVSALAYTSGYDRFWQGGPADHFAARYTATLDVARAGKYTFYLTSDDGSELFIDGVRVIGNDGLHPPLEKRVTLSLGAGDHRVE